MYPHPAYIATGEIRELRALLTRRRMLQAERNRWQCRARAALRASGRTLRTGGHYLRRSLRGYLEVASELEVALGETLALYCCRSRWLRGARTDWMMVIAGDERRPLTYVMG